MRAEGAGGPSERVSERGTRRATNGWPPDEVFGRRKRDTQEDGAGGREGRREDPLPSRPANPSSDVNREYELAEKVSYASEQGKWRARLTGMNPFQSAARGCYGLDSRKREILSPARWQKERERGRNREGEPERAFGIAFGKRLWTTTRNTRREGGGSKTATLMDGPAWPARSFGGFHDEGIKHETLQRLHPRRCLRRRRRRFICPRRRGYDAPFSRTAVVASPYRQPT